MQVYTETPISIQGILFLIVEEKEKKPTHLPRLSFQQPREPQGQKSSPSLTTPLSAALGPNLPADLIHLLHTLPFFAGSCSDSFLAEISKGLRVRKCGPGDVLVKHGDKAKTMFFILKGTLNVVSQDREVELAELTSGSFCIPN